MSKRIYVGNVPYNTTEDEIRSHFSACGQVNRVQVCTDRESGRPRGFVFVDMDDADGSRAIAEMNGSVLGGRTLVVNEARERPERARGNDNAGRGRHDERKGGRDRDW